ncbi:hypothetical protein D3C86_1998230 [compost metagenome]
MAKDLKPRKQIVRRALAYTDNRFTRLKGQMIDSIGKFRILQQLLRCLSRLLNQQAFDSQIGIRIHAVYDRQSVAIEVACKG